MSKVIIHIGMHKTGTTFLQKVVFPNLNNTFYAHNNEFFVPWKKQLYKKADNMLLSYEGFSGFPWNKFKEKNSWLKSFHLNIDQIRKFFPNAIIIIFFRKQGDLLLSIYKQYLQEGGELSINEFYGNGKILEKKDLSIKSRLNYIKDCFDQVYFLNYELFSDEKLNYLDVFFRKELNLRLNKTESLPKSNISISGSKIKILRRYNIIYNKFPRLIQKPINILKLAPRKLVQEKLSFWQTKDSKELKELKVKINEEFKMDWEYFLSQQWKRQ